jgi:hypothetical protein
MELGDNLVFEVAFTIKSLSNHLELKVIGFGFGISSSSSQLFIACIYNCLVRDEWGFDLAHLLENFTCSLHVSCQ